MKLSVFVIIVAVLAATTTTAATAAPAAPAFPERLDLPSQGLESRVEFWEKVYTQYGEDDVIIHDRIHVNLIYDVAIRDDQTEKIAAVRQVLDEIRNNLATPENLSVTAQQIQTAILANAIPLTPASLAELRDNVDTKDGIKERFHQGMIP